MKPLLTIDRVDTGNRCRVVVGRDHHDRKVLKVVYWGSPPPSVNHLHTYTKERVILSTEARAWRAQFLAALGPVMARVVMDPSKPYELSIIYRCHDLFLKNRKQEEGYEEVYRRVDSSNLIKFAEDCFTNLSGVRDHHHFTVRCTKVPAGENDARVTFILRELDLTTLQEWEASIAKVDDAN